MSGPSRAAVAKAVAMLQAELDRNADAIGRVLSAEAEDTRPDLAAAERLWRRALDALRELDLRPVHVQVYPSRGGGELNVYLDTKDPTDVRRFASFLGLTGEMEEREELRPEDAAPNRVVFWTIKELDESGVTRHRLWASARFPLQ